MRISTRRAPIALRTPISRVRSVTEMVMMAITPIPPTISAIEEITTSDSSTACEICSHTLSTASWVTRSKSFGLSSVRPWRMRMTASTSRMASSRATSSRGTTAIITACPPIGPRRMRSFPNCFRNAVYGMMAKSSWPRLNPPAAGRLPITPDDRVVEAADPHVLADRIDAPRLEQRLVWPVPDHRDAACGAAPPAR